MHHRASSWLDGLSLRRQLRQLPILVIGVAFYVASTALTYRIAAREFLTRRSLSKKQKTVSLSRFRGAIRFLLIDL